MIFAIDGEFVEDFVVPIDQLAMELWSVFIGQLKD
jgi:hypothetical protein